MRVVLVVLLTGLDTCLALSCMAQACVMTTCDPRVTKDSCVDGEFRIKGSVCHCCDICIPYKSEHKSCDALELVPLGLPPRNLCRPPLLCIYGVCKRPGAELPTILQQR